MALAPDEPALLSNAALAAVALKDFAYAKQTWEKLRKIEPEDWQTRAKLIQTYQALGDCKARDAERDALIAMHKENKFSELIQRGYYCLMLLAGT